MFSGRPKENSIEIFDMPSSSPTKKQNLHSVANFLSKMAKKSLHFACISWNNVQFVSCLLGMYGILFVALCMAIPILLAVVLLLTTATPLLVFGMFSEYFEVGKKQVSLKSIPVYIIAFFMLIPSFVCVCVLLVEIFYGAVFVLFLGLVTYLLIDLLKTCLEYVSSSVYFLISLLS